MGLLEYFNEQKDAAMNDYHGLLKAYPNAIKFGQAVMNEFEPHVPKPADYDINHPERMQEWAMSVIQNSNGSIPSGYLKHGMIYPWAKQ